MKLAKEHTAFAQSFTPRGTVRLVDADEAARLFPPLYDRMLAERAGMFTRTPAWWETRRLAPSSWGDGGPKQFALLELGGAPAGHAIYNVQQEWRGGSSSGRVNVMEAVAPTPEATRELWRWLLDFDWTSEFHARLLPLDHPLFALLAEPRRMRFEVSEGTWVRLLDVQAALAGRSFGAGEIVVELTDAFVPENAGRWRIGGDGAERTEAAAELALDVTSLGSVYLGASRSPSCSADRACRSCRRARPSARTSSFAPPRSRGA
jgi:predicted acetyltransferase